MGLNAAAPDANKEAAKLFLEWMSTPEFATLLGDTLPGFFPISSNTVELMDPYANAFLALNEGADLDVRWAWEKLLDGAPDGYTLMQNGALAVISGEMTPQEAADALQAGLAEWFEPAQNCPSGM